MRLHLKKYYAIGAGLTIFLACLVVSTTSLITSRPQSVGKLQYVTTETSGCIGFCDHYPLSLHWYATDLDLEQQKLYLEQYARLIGESEAGIGGTYDAHLVELKFMYHKETFSLQTYSAEDSQEIVRVKKLKTNKRYIIGIMDDEWKILRQAVKR